MAEQPWKYILNLKNKNKCHQISGSPTSSIKPNWNESSTNLCCVCACYQKKNTSSFQQMANKSNGVPGKNMNNEKCTDRLEPDFGSSRKHSERG